jgi:hypothetical protein
LGVELEGLELTLFGTASTVVRPMVMPRTSGVLETITRTTPLRNTEPFLLPATQEHHIIPNQWKGHEVVREARQEGFKQDGKENKIDVEKFEKNSGDGRHGNHPEYNKEILRKLTDFEKSNPTRTPKESLDFFRKTVQELKEVINKNSDTKINDLFNANVVTPTDNTRVQQPRDKTDVYPCPGGPNCT